MSTRDMVQIGGSDLLFVERARERYFETWPLKAAATGMITEGQLRSHTLLHRFTRKIVIERLETRRLLAQLPEPITAFGERCGEEVVHSQQPGVAYFTLASHGECWVNNGAPLIYRTDGTATGTYALGPIEGADSVSTPLEIGKEVFFSTEHFNALGEGSFYRSDGTPHGTVKVSREATVWELDGDVYYVPRAFDEGSSFEGHTELRRIAGSSDELVREIGIVSGFAHAGDVVIFAVNRERREVTQRDDGGFNIRTGVVGELWKTDGTTDGTIMLENSDADASVRGEFKNGRAWYTKRDEDGLHGNWSTDGTEEGTLRLQIDGGKLTEKFGNYYLVEPRRNSELRTLRATDGLSVIDLVELTDPPRGIFNLGDELYFEADGQLWRTDGTRTGTRAITELGSGVSGTQYHDTEQFFYFQQTQPIGLYRVNRTSGETTRIVNEPTTLRAGTGAMLIYRLKSDPTTDFVLKDGVDAPQRFDGLGAIMDQALLELSDEQTLLFQGSSELEGFGYWLTDGTARGTYKVSELPLGATNTVFSRAEDFFQVGNSIVFDAVHARSTEDDGRLFSFALHGPEALPGDVNGNGTVDFSDFLALAANFGRTGVNVQADLDRDGEVEMSDFRLLQNNYGKSTKSYL